MLEIDCITKFKPEYLKKPFWYFFPLCKQPDKLVKYLDDELTFLKDMTYRSYSGDSSISTFLVEKNNEKENKLHVLKIGSLYSPWTRFHLLREKRVLKKLKDLESITHLEKTYATEHHLALLKEYQKGELLWRWLRDKDNESELRKKHHTSLEKTIKIIHSHGFAGMDIKGDNIIVPLDENEPPKIIDLGYARSKYRMLNSRFKTLQAHDYLHLNELFNY
ncbi:MAG: hypothetical protein KKF46_07960 [Nanoarchaeota archaeon]|nr:hypothetical protein [Nanoarchaeota archaeon]MBU1322262.1 hypothetical protein [Nanoarchaeota archaeon]MBU1598242.1 hypothetical protein [Nanoarchaeota archaeon]MBU2441995.1 hypothetical protein [Nanoarchaeota archaeon]